MKLKRNIVLICLAVLLAFTASQCDPSGEIRMTVPTDSIYGTVWEDEDKNGVMTDAEERVNGVKILLLDEDGNNLNSILTDSNGAYIYKDLKQYQDTSAFEIQVIPPPGLGFTDQGRRDVEYASHVDSMGLSGSIPKDKDKANLINAGFIIVPIPDPEDDTSVPPTEEPSGDTTDDQCGTADTPTTWDTEYTDDNGNTYTLHFTFWGMTDLLYFYAPAVHDDGTDAAQVLNPLVQILPGGVVGITHTDCMGGCKLWTPDIWFGNGENAMMQFGDNPCLFPDYRIVMIGFSTGAELALYICPYTGTCILGVSVSPNSYYGVPLPELIGSALITDKLWIFGHGKKDPEMVQIEGYVSDKIIMWNDVNHHQEAEQNGFLFTRTDTADHGPDFWNNNPWFHKTIKLAIQREF